ncbi:MAG: MarR family winged helix-turn-helix transcriptional regulator [Chloroflexota bacterium]
MQETKSLDDARITTYGRLFEAWATVTRRLDEQLEQEAGVSLTWYAVLLLLGRSQAGVRPIGELSLATAFTSGGLTRLVDRMEQAGYVKRQPCPTDRRVIYVALTESGRALLERATAVHVRGIQEYIVAKLDPDEVEQMNRILAKLGPGDAPADACD